MTIEQALKESSRALRKEEFGKAERAFNEAARLAFIEIEEKRKAVST